MAEVNILPARKYDKKKSLLIKNLKRHKYIYLMIIPVLVWYLLFCYLPMYGIVIAFQDFSIVKGISGSKWTGLHNIISFLNGVYAGRVIFNTVYLNLLGLIFGFPAPIIFALLLNEILNEHAKRIFQTISYLPFFISMVVICGLVREFTSTTGIISVIIGKLTGEPVIQNLIDLPQYYRPIYVLSDIWQGVGFSSIIYLSAISSINPELHEAAVIDGAGRWKRVIHIILPGITSTIVMLLILALGNLMSSALEKPLLLYNSANISVSDLVSTYIYRQGILVQQFGYGAAVGLFNSVINFIILIAANRVARKISGYSLF